MDEITDINQTAETETEIFYVADDGIVMVSKLTEKKTVFVRSSSINSLQVYDGYVYYCENRTTIKRIGISGGTATLVADSSQFHCLHPNDAWLRNFDVYGNFIYIRSPYTSLIRFDIEAQSDEIFLKDVDYYAFSNNYCYYIDHAEKTFSIFQKSISTGQTELVRGDGISKRNMPPEEYDEHDWYDCVFSVEGEIYYTMRSPAKVYKLEQDGIDILIDGFEQIGDAKYLSVAIHTNRIYYTIDNGSAYSHLFECNLHSGEKRDLLVLVDYHNALGFKIIDGYVFYISVTDRSVVFVPLPN
jgi:hypothetical protein